MKPLTVFVSSVFALMVAIMPVTAQAQSAPQAEETRLSMCQAIARNEFNGGWPGEIRIASDELPLLKVQNANKVSAGQVRISYVGHSTFRIEDADDLTIATDFAGFAGLNVIPEVVTMNHAHATHFTVSPDPRIAHVLRGWGKEGKPARHHLKIGDAIIRNVTTNINSQWAGYEPDGNSIFIFEMAGLCIGHLGHLHHVLTDDHYIKIGRLDVLMVPVDGGYTLNVADMSSIVKRVQASLVLPMHWFGNVTLQYFLDEMRGEFPVELSSNSSLKVSLNSLPAQPTVMVLRPESSYGNYDYD